MVGKRKPRLTAGLLYFWFATLTVMLATLLLLAGLLLSALLATLLLTALLLLARFLVRILILIHFITLHVGLEALLITCAP